MKQKIILIMLPLLFIGGCAYQLRYTISSENSNISEAAMAPKTFAVEKTNGTSTESALLDIVTRSLERNGWNRAPEKDALYIFTVSYKTEKRQEPDEFWLMKVFGGKNSLAFGKHPPQRRTYLYQYIEIKAYGDNRKYIWTSSSKTGPVLQDIETLAKHIIPEAVSLFPKKGYWEIEDEVYLHTEE
jgi:hypothetical protein